MKTRKNKNNKVDPSDTKDEAIEERKEKKLLSKKRKKVKTSETDSADTGKINKEIAGADEHCFEAEEREQSKLRKKKRQIEEKPLSHEVRKHNNSKDGSKDERVKSKKVRKAKRKGRLPVKEENLLEKNEAEEDEVYQISSGDEDCSMGMKKWITEYHQRRPGLKVLQERIDVFITAHEAEEEEARKEKEARIAEDGWTVVVHHKGRKKTTDPETGIAVGSVASAAVQDKMAMKKNKDVELDFYRFQKREAKRNEIMLLQSKFEQDKKRIQQMRAARKFRPY